MRREVEPSRLRSSMVVVALLLAAGGVGAGEESPYGAMTDREIKALSDEQTRAYLEGHGMGLALAAELNGYPGPRHVLELRETLGLSVEQHGKMQQIFDSMQNEAVQLGEQIVEREGTLDELFMTERIEVQTLVTLSEEIGRLNGRLRGVHLRAHLETVRVLSPHQRQQYRVLRGYSSAENHDPTPHH